MSGNVKKIDTKVMNAAIIDFREKVKEFEEIKNNIDETTSKLLLTWIGKSSKAYELQYSVLKRSLTDIGASLYDLHDQLEQAALTYMEADDDAAKSIEAK